MTAVSSLATNSPLLLGCSWATTFKDWCLVGTGCINSDMVACTSDTAAHDVFANITALHTGRVSSFEHKFGHCMQFITVSTVVILVFPDTPLA